MAKLVADTVDKNIMRLLETDNLQVGGQENLQQKLGEVRKEERRNSIREGTALTFLWGKRKVGEEDVGIKRLKAEFPPICVVSNKRIGPLFLPKMFT